MDERQESLLIKGWKVDRRTLTAAKKGELTKSEYSTLIHLRNWVKELAQNPDLTIDELFVVEEDAEDGEEDD